MQIGFCTRAVLLLSVLTVTVPAVANVARTDTQQDTGMGIPSARNSGFQSPDPGSGTGGVSVTGMINCFPTKFSVKSDKVIAEPISTVTANATPNVVFYVTPSVGYLFDEIPGHMASSVLHVTAEGPVLNSIASTKVTRDINCTDAVVITAHIWQSNQDNAGYGWQADGYTGSLTKNALWRPAIDFDLVTHNPKVPLHVQWILHDAHGAVLSQAKIHGIQEQSFPLIVEKEIIGGESRRDNNQ